jgi:arsenate reductase-like glutaredoxin family protein
MIIPLDQVHPHWRIDTREVSVQITMNDGDEKMEKLLEDLYKKYQEWPMDKKEFTQQKIVELINQTNVLFEPMVKSHKGNTKKSKKKSLSSTRQDPSQFVIVEAALQQNSRFSDQNSEVGDKKTIPLH